MTINLTQIIAALEAKANSTDSASSISDVLRLSIGSEAVSDGAIIYDSAGVMPTNSAFIGTMAAASNGTIYFYNGTAWNAVDSAETIVPSPPPVPNAQGENYGYTADGYSAISSPSYRREIDKFSFASGGNATDVGDTLSSGDLEVSGAGQSSTSHGYHSGDTSPNLSTNIIQKYSFTVDGNATDVGDLTLTRGRCAGTSSDDNGYTHGGGRVPNLPTSYLNTIDKFPFSSDANATDVGDLVAAAKDPAGQSSSTHGYASGGKHPSYTNGQVDIQKYSFSTDGNSSDVGDLTRGSYGPAGQNSSTHGYTSAGQNASPFNQYGNIIDKFSFSSDANATDVGDASEGRIQPAGTSSTSDGYTQGGGLPSPAYASNVIDKFPFSSDASATDVGDLTLGRQQCSGSQY
jgi:hypothetical protein